jgi:ribosome-binding factor A
MSEVKRAVRVGERVKEALGKLFNGEVRDPRVKGVLVSRVAMTDDLRNVRVYIRMLEGGDVPARRAEALEGLGRAASMLRQKVTKDVGLRFAPELRFYYDEGLDKQTRIEELLDEVKKDRGGSSS